MHTVFALLCFVVVIYWLIFPYPSGLLHWHCGNLTIAPVPVKQPWWIWLNTSCEFIINDCITTTKQSTTKPCAYFLGYTVGCDGYCTAPEVDLEISFRFTTLTPEQCYPCLTAGGAVLMNIGKWINRVNPLRVDKFIYDREESHIHARNKSVLIIMNINLSWPGDAICWPRSGSTLAQVMACWLTVPSL